MEQVTSSQDNSPIQGSLSSDEKQIKKCCLGTVEEHVINNSMMVCQACKYIIKCFSNKGSFDHYVLFCRSRDRKIKTGQYKNYWVVVFHYYRR